MALTTQTVTGTIYYSDGSPMDGAIVSFTLNGTASSVTDPGTIPPNLTTVTCNASGEFTTNLWPNSLGVGATDYTATVTYTDVTSGKSLQKILGKFTVPSEGTSYTLSELLATGVVAPTAVYLGVITQAQYDEITTLANDLGDISDAVAETEANAAQTAADRAYLESQVTPLYALASPNLPVGPVEIIPTFNNQLNTSIYCDGTRIHYNVAPYDLIDFTKNSDLTINEYYVNFATGLDTNGGASSGDAWKTLTKVASSAASPCIVYIEDEIVGVNSLGTSFLFDGDIKIKSGHSSGTTILTNMVESYTKATFAWADEGDGVWSTSAASTSSTIFGRLGTMVFDRKYPDAYGGAMPCPDVGSEAACRAMPGSQWHDTANSVKYVHLYDGREPDPADGFIYSFPAGGANFQQQAATGGTILLEGIHSYRNAKGATSANIRYRNANSTSANTSKFGAKNCLVYGGSGNNFEIYDSSIGVLQGCVSRYSHKDGFNYHSFVTAGTKGEFITIYEHDCVSLNAGYDEFADHTALGTSENCTTAHDSLHIIRTNTVAGGCVGAVFADVNGVHSINYGCTGSQPGGAWPYVFWHEKLVAAGTTQKMYLWGCAAHDSGDVSVSLISNQQQTGADTNKGDVYVKFWRGQTDGLVTGPIKDFSGTIIT